MITLGIETSCDETGLALYDPTKIKTHPSQGLVAQVLHSQVQEHAQYGGIVPELAAREHLSKIQPLLNELLSKAGLSSLSAISNIAYTHTPGLLGALLVGESFAQGLAFALKVPLQSIHHLEAHLLSAYLSPDFPKTKPPFYALLVSGGHTEIILVKDWGVYDKVFGTRDDAMGEAFDKCAKLLDIGYPGGALLSSLAKEGKESYPFSRPLAKDPSLDLSFSGLKTQVRYLIEKLGGAQKLQEQEKKDIAKSFELAAIDTLLIKLRRLMKKNALPLLCGGGVMANDQLREGLLALAQKHQTQAHFPEVNLCTDNGAMIAFLGALRIHDKEKEFPAIPRKPLSLLNAISPPSWFLNWLQEK